MNYQTAFWIAASMGVTFFVFLIAALWSLSKSMAREASAEADLEYLLAQARHPARRQWKESDAPIREIRLP